MVMSMFFYIKKKIQTRSLYTNSSHISASSKLLISPSDYILGYEHALTTFLQASAILYTPFAIFGLILRKCIEYDKKQKGKNINNSV